VSNDGRHAISLNYDRLRQIRPVTGYAGGDATAPLVNRPTDDGLFLVDLATGGSRLLVSVDAACRVLAPPGAIQNQPFWLEHAMFSRDDRRIFLLARAFDPKSPPTALACDRFCRGPSRAPRTTTGSMAAASLSRASTLPRNGITC
jgi:hypothetical protein